VERGVIWWIQKNLWDQDEQPHYPLISENLRSSIAFVRRRKVGPQIVFKIFSALH
jgi:hypothetical protein